MSNFVYKDMFTVSCKRNSHIYPCGYEMPNVISVNEYDNEVEVCSATKIKGFERGWVGDLKFIAEEIDICDCEKREKEAIAHYIKDVVLKQIKINNDDNNNSFVNFTYVFLKF